jgi:histidinol-phosphate/aromatic aminotransferase/cobyric acid decarboxylase-like protein
MDETADDLDALDEHATPFEIPGLLGRNPWAEPRDLDPQEKERFYSRLSTIPGVRTLPSIGDWILLEVPAPADLARKVNRRLAPGVLSVPRHVPGAVRLHVADPKSNELLFQLIRELVA